MDHRTKKITGYKDAHCPILNGWKDKTICIMLNGFQPNNRASKHIKQKLLEVKKN